MPFCPSCQSEYRPGFTLCKDCDVELVESLPEAQPEEGINTAVELVELATFPDHPEAEMIRELLEENGIVTVLMSDAGAGISPLSSPSTLLVSRDEEERARSLYQEYFAGDEIVEASEQEDAEQEMKGDIS
jgi:hypothetical protein